MTIFLMNIIKNLIKEYKRNKFIDIAYQILKKKKYEFAEIIRK